MWTFELENPGTDIENATVYECKNIKNVGERSPHPPKESTEKSCQITLLSTY